MSICLWLKQSAAAVATSREKPPLAKISPEDQHPAMWSDTAAGAADKAGRRDF